MRKEVLDLKDIKQATTTGQQGVQAGINVVNEEPVNTFKNSLPMNGVLLVKSPPKSLRCCENGRNRGLDIVAG